MSDDRDYYDDDFDDGLEDEEDEFEDCGMMPDGQCTMAGSEWCDWDCPLQKMRDRARRALSLDREPKSNEVGE